MGTLYQRGQVVIFGGFCALQTTAASSSPTAALSAGYTHDMLNQQAVIVSARSAFELALLLLNFAVLIGLLSTWFSLLFVFWGTMLNSLTGAKYDEIQRRFNRCFTRDSGHP